MVKIPNISACEIEVEALKKLDQQSIRLINSSKIIINYKPGETILKQGSRANQALIIQSGYTKMLVEGDYHKALVFRYCKKNDFIGVSGLFTDNIYTFSLLAVDYCKVCFIDYDIISDCIDKNTLFAREIIVLLCSEKTMLHSKLICLTQKQAPGRVANALLYLNNEVYQNNNKVVAGRTEIAELTGMTKDSAGRVLKDFQDEKIITISGKIVSIKNLEKLIQIKSLG